MSALTSFLKKVWLDTIAEYPTRRTIHDVNTGTDTVVTVTRNVGTITQNGDVWNASNMNGLETRIADAFASASDVHTYTIGTTWVANSDEGDYTKYPYKQTIATTDFSHASDAGYQAPDWETLSPSGDFLTSAEEEDDMKLCAEAKFTTTGITILAKEQTTNALTLRVRGLGQWQ